jgi:Aerotolerance regulator N-terminal
MTITWLIPSALAGLALVILPIVIHLLARARRRIVPFPSLRFLPATRLSALSRRRIDDWPLLILRLLAVAAAALALAGPAVTTTPREARWAARVSRAVLLLPPARSSDEERMSAYRVAEFAPRGTLADAIRAALRWLERQPPSSREIVIAGELRASPGLEAALSQIPSHVGIRFLPSREVSVNREATVPMLIRGPAAPAMAKLRVRLDDERTLVGGRVNEASGAIILDVRAAAEDRPVAQAALAAVIASGLMLDQAVERRLVVAWDGADVEDLGPAVTPPTRVWIPPALERIGHPGMQHGDGLLVRVPGRPTDEEAAITLGEIVRGVFADDRHQLEPRLAGLADLAVWSRPAVGLPPNTTPGDEGDRRWLWALALAVLIMEQVWRRRAPGQARADAAEATESRVA